VHPQVEREVHFFTIFLLGQLFEEKKVHPRENPGYAYATVLARLGRRWTVLMI